ncbi:transcription factor E2F8-like [Trichogramma pretiosum]|uniref:transcription factor E2F8-like n=1 Tax=Trichogramma pretiosum TaxID=7493 RepID=UPI0006C95588|nr:transcription factor E2F8-like [Trichogramma pretiosum]
MAFLKTPEKQRIVFRDLGNNIPFSPTSNLKCLAEAAASSNQLPAEGYKTPSPFDCGSDVKKTRKEKSLTELCKKFLNLFPLKLDENCEICLNETTDKLKTEKRRLYDIINVLESLDMASRACKNKYYWYGETHLHSTLFTLRASAIRLGLDKKIQEIQRVNRAFISNDSKLNNFSPNDFMVPQSPIVNFKFPESSNNDKEDKSLGVMCRKFLMLFLVSMKNGVINLDIAAKVLINESDLLDSSNSSQNAKSKASKGRRLYDIANVLLAIGLIEKVDMYSAWSIKKPIYRYCGPDLDSLQTGENEQNRFNHSPFYSSTPKRSFSCLPFKSNHPRPCRSESYTETKKRKLFTSDDDLGSRNQPHDLSQKRLFQKSRSLNEILNKSATDFVESEIKSLKHEDTSPESRSSTCSQFISSPVQLINMPSTPSNTPCSLRSIHVQKVTPVIKKPSSVASTVSNYLVITPKLQQTTYPKSIQLFKEKSVEGQIEQFSNAVVEKSVVIQTEENKEMQVSKEPVIKLEINNISSDKSLQSVQVGDSKEVIYKLDTTNGIAISVGDVFQCVKMGDSLGLRHLKTSSDTK